jgi:lysophospholipase L1-like esterase
MDESPWICEEKSPQTCDSYPSPIDNPKEPKAVWRYVLAPPEAQGEPFGTSVEQACQLDPSMLVILIGNNDALNAPVASDMRELTKVSAFQDRYNALIEAVLDCTEGRASILVGTIPDVATIPHMRNLGEVVGAMPFTIPKGPTSLQDDVTRWFEKVYLSPFDENDECHGNDVNGVCLGGEEGGAKIGIGILGGVLEERGFFGSLSLLVRQSETLRRKFSWKELRLRRDQVMHPADLQYVQAHVNAFNDHVRRLAERSGWPVMDMRQLFRDRTSEIAKTDATRLNGLFTGTARAVRLEGDTFRRGVGNTMLGWDGVHPNSAGYSVAANEVIRVLNEKLKAMDFGGLGKDAVVSRVPRETITKLLKENYLTLSRTRIRGWQDLLSTVE